MSQFIRKYQTDNDIYALRVDSLEFPTLLVEKLLNHSVRTVRRLKSLTAERMKKMGLSDEESKLIETKLEELFSKKYLPKIAVVTTECSVCGSPLIKRAGKFGEFMGCPKYPKCKYARSTV